MEKIILVIHSLCFVFFLTSCKQIQLKSASPSIQNPSVEQEPESEQEENPEQADASNPSTPTSLQLVSRTTSSLSVSWQASQDNVGVTGYRVYLNSSFNQLINSTSVTLSNLQSGTSYQIRVSAVDAAGNESAQSSVLSASTEASNPPPPPPPMGENSIRTFIFGHSLLVHEHTPNPTEEKKVPHWMHHLSQAANRQFKVDGQYGFLRQHANFSTLNPQWGFQYAQSEWTNPQTPFANVNYNAIISTPANFVQWQSPQSPYYDDPNVSPLSATLSIIDQSRAAHPNIPFYIYMNWPEMNGAVYGSFPNNVNLTQYHTDTLSGNFYNWFISYHDQILAARQGSNIKMIPAGPIMAKLLRDTMLSGIPIASLYEDDAPHGQPTLYFLASLVVYMAVYKTQAPLNYTIPNTVHSLVRNNYPFIVNYIWTELNAFNFSNGNSRVF